MNLFIRAHSRAQSKAPVVLDRDAFAGLAFIWHRPVILGAIARSVHGAVGGVTAFFLRIIASELRTCCPSGSVLRSTPAVGAMMLGLWLSYRPYSTGAPARFLLDATTIFGLATIGVGRRGTLHVACAALAHRRRGRVQRRHPADAGSERYARCHARTGSLW